MLVYLLYSRLINLVVIPKFYKFSAQFFTLLSYEPITVCFLPTNIIEEMWNSLETLEIVNVKVKHSC